VTPDGTRVYVADFGDDTVSVIDTATNTVVATVVVGGNPADVAVTPDSAHAYVTNNDDDTVSVIDTATNTAVTTVVVGSSPAGIEISSCPVTQKERLVFELMTADANLPDGTTLTVETLPPSAISVVANGCKGVSGDLTAFFPLA
jgi:YVTN family beta-propeller protein